jgi:hypothetical protein
MSKNLLKTGRAATLAAAICVWATWSNVPAYAQHDRGSPAAQSGHQSGTVDGAAAVSKPKPRVTVVALGEADKAGVARQKVCPVTGAALGSMGAPVKVLVGDQPLYLCCKGCLGEVRKSPDKYLAKAATPQPKQ